MALKNLELSKDDVELVLRLAKFRLDIKGWLTPDEEAHIGRLMDRLHTEAIRLHNEEVLRAR